MPNSIALAQKYEPILDTANSNISFIGANVVKIPKMTLSGLADYSRNVGFVQGVETLTWETLTLSKDRGVSFTVDAMDDEETLGTAFGRVAGEFVRVHEVPELDAYRFAKMASAVTPVKADITVGTTDVPDLIDTATMAMDDAEVPYEGRILFVSPKAYAGLKAKITRYLANETTVDRNVEMYNDMRVITVPQARFNTAVTLYDGTSNFGFAPTAGGFKINFMIVHPTAVAQIVKHRVPRIWTPDQNINADAYKFDFRVYHDCFVLENKVSGIYCHAAATANQ